MTSLVSFTVLPSAVLDLLRAKADEIRAVEILNGKSGADVYRAHTSSRSVIVKRSTQSFEPAFYVQIAPILRAHDIAIPQLYAHVESDDADWLVIEDVPQPLPDDAIYHHPQVIRLLARLHSLPLDAVPELPQSYIPVWTDDMTEQSLACFSESQRQTLRPVFQKLQAEAQSLFEPLSLISGDPNPRNWGVDRKSRVVLFDWERFSRAHPAIDLAILQAGLGRKEQFIETASAYLRERQQLNTKQADQVDPVDRVDQLVRLMLIAKLWTALEFLQLYSSGNAEPDTFLAWLTTEIPVWLETVGLS